MAKKRGKKGKSAKNAQKNRVHSEPEEIVRAPHSIVINRGKLGKNVNELMLNFRKLMQPYTAGQLKVQKHNVVKDFLHVAGLLHVSHLIVFTKSQESSSMYFRIVKLPHGPTLTFEIKEYALVRDIISSQKRSLMYEKLFDHHPLLVLNNFSGEGLHFKLMTTTFQNMFPSINVNKTNLNTIRRCLLLNYNDDGTIDLRQYAVKLVPTGISKAVKKLIHSRVPNLSQFENIDDFLQKSGNLSESEVEMDTPSNTVTLPQPISSRGNITSEKSAVRLYELGPRLKLQLIKIEEGVMTGEVLFHQFFKRTPEEINQLKAKLKAKKRLKEKRKALQKQNVERKAKAAERDNRKNEVKAQEGDSENEQDDDAEFYRQEVGTEPEEGVLKKKRKAPADKHKSRKKVKFSENSMNDKVGNKKKSESGKQTAQEFLARRKKNKDRKAKLKMKKKPMHGLKKKLNTSVRGKRQNK